ncbi:alpha/beta hydrolase [Bacillus massiliigorillae]|uniref:alpha/beta hydrolase n=1 Tax=Bacillus massiliigorillae TaxID=1243664 RepID=UPI0003A22FB7|nr:esterase family protein [Bacillus massiliigorillae]
MSIPMGRIQDLEFYSEALQENIKLLVYLPPNYSPFYKYTLCITNDGKDYFQMGRIGRVADSLLHTNKIEDVIIIGIPYNDVHDRRSKYHPEGEKNESYIRFLAHELVPFLDQEFPTHGVGNGRMLIGDSLAGTVSLMTALRYPNMFGKVAMQSPYVDQHVKQAIQDFTTPHLLQIYHVIGKNEVDVPTTDGKRSNFIKPNRELHSLLTEKDFPLFYEEFDGEHTWKYWQKDLPRAVEMMLKSDDL